MTRKERAVRKDLWLIFIVSAAATLAAAALLGVRGDDSGLREATIMGSIVVIATGSVLTAGGRLLSHVAKNW